MIKNKGYTEKEETDYQKFFKKTLEKFGVSSPAELEGDKKKEFFDYIDKNWEADNEKEESISFKNVADKIVMECCSSALSKGSLSETVILIGSTEHEGNPVDIILSKCPDDPKCYNVEVQIHTNGGKTTTTYSRDFNNYGDAMVEFGIIKMNNFLPEKFLLKRGFTKE